MAQKFSPANIQYFFTMADTRFTLGIRNAPTWSNEWCTTYNSDTENVLHGWIEMPDNMRIWRGARVVQDPAPQTYSVPMLPWEITMALDQFAFIFDRWGLYMPIAQRIGQKTAKLQDYAIRDMLQGNGELGSAPFNIGPDGLSFWNTAHPVDVWDPSKGVYPNDYGAAGVTVSGQTVGGLFSTNSYSSIWSDMSGRKNASNEAIGVNPDRLLVPSQLRFPGAVVLQSAMFAPMSIMTLGGGNFPTPGSPTPANAPFVGAMDNPLRGSADLRWTPDLNSQPSAFYLGDTSDIMKPLGWAQHTAPTFVVRNAPTDPIVFDQHRFLWGSWAIATPHWGFAWNLSRSGI
jgi:phage major head subunit gpT-like protein